MLTSQDIKKLAEYLKEIFVTKEDFNELNGKISKLQTSVDAIALGYKNQNNTNAVTEHRLKKTESWIEKAAPKVGVPFKH